MIFSLLIAAAMSFANSPDLARQILLDRAGFSCNTIDGVWGAKSERALEHYERATGSTNLPPEKVLFRTYFVNQRDLDSLGWIPSEPAAKAQLDHLGYESIQEMFAERGHLSIYAIAKLNPHVDWNNVTVGTRIMIPDFPSMEEELSVWPKDRDDKPQRPEAAVVRISLSRFEITVYDAEERLIALFPCSIAKDKRNLPPHGELRIETPIANPNYTYTSDSPLPNGRRPRYLWPPGPNCPIGVAWMGLNLPGYGIHGTPRPESIGTAESHGCFRLSNWNAARLYALCPPDTKVYIEP